MFTLTKLFVAEFRLGLVSFKLYNVLFQQHQAESAYYTKDIFYYIGLQLGWCQFQAIDQRIKSYLTWEMVQVFMKTQISPPSHSFIKTFGHITLMIGYLYQGNCWNKWKQYLHKSVLWKCHRKLTGEPHSSPVLFHSFKRHDGFTGTAPSLVADRYGTHLNVAIL